MKTLRYYFPVRHVNLTGDTAHCLHYLSAGDSRWKTLSVNWLIGIGSVRWSESGIMLWVGYNNTTLLLTKCDMVKEWEKEFSLGYKLCPTDKLENKTKNSSGVTWAGKYLRAIIKSHYQRGKTKSQRSLLNKVTQANLFLGVWNRAQHHCGALSIVYKLTTS